MMRKRCFSDTSGPFIDSHARGVYNERAKLGYVPKTDGEGKDMKRTICALLAICLLALALPALAETKLSEVQMIYEDYDENYANETVSDEPTLEELEGMLKRARKNPAELDNCTMNCTLLCTDRDGAIYDFAVATDGCPFIMDRSSEKVYRLSDEDQARLWEIFELIRETMGYDAASVFDW